MRPSNASLCSIPNVSIFEKRDKHSCGASAIINMSIVLIVDGLLSTLHASANRIWCCEANAVSLFSSRASSLVSFRFAARPSLTKSEEKERLLAV